MPRIPANNLFPVGAGLPAMTAVHPKLKCQTDRYREQARSHRGFVLVNYWTTGPHAQTSTSE
jgi:hypothetical protein